MSNVSTLSKICFCNFKALCHG